MNQELFNCNSSIFKIIDPDEQNDYFVVLSGDEREYDWLDKINKNCIIDKIDKTEIKKKIEKYLKKFGIKKKIFNSGLNEYILKEKLLDLAKTSQSPITAEKTAKSIFNKDIVSNIVVNQFIECSKWLYDAKRSSISLTDGNIFIWNIIISNFNNEKLNFNSKELKNIKGIEFELCFHSEFYPNYPPVIEIINPPLKDSLNYRISNSKMVQLDYWTPARSIQYIIDRIINILEKYGELDIERIINEKHLNKNVIEFENYLIKFASFSNSIFENDEIDMDVSFIKFKEFGVTNSNNTLSKYWKKGTGYGHSESTIWNIKEFIESQKDKNEKLENVIKNIVIVLNKNKNSDNFDLLIKLLEKSLIIPYLKQQFKDSSILEIHEKENLFKLYLSLFETISVEKSAYLFDDSKKNDRLFDILQKRSNEFEQSLKFDKENDLAYHFVEIFNDKIYPCFVVYINKKKELLKLKSAENSEIDNTNLEDEINIKEFYKNKMTDFRFDTSSILDTNYRNDYKKIFDSEKSLNWKKCQKRLASELTSFMQINQLPIDYDSSIFVRVDDDNPMIIRALITGPVDTPYDSGCFIFDIYTPAEYPNKAPMFWFMNHGGNRFNPNLYDCGKVCLSILGTYIGPKPTQSEQWNSSVSTLLQVLISIQSQILIDEPYFNEPGYESLMNTESGKKKSTEYNNFIRLYTMKSTVRDLLINPKSYPQFEDVIKQHFELKKDYILKTYQKWVDEASPNSKNEYTTVFDEIKSALFEINLK